MFKIIFVVLGLLLVVFSISFSLGYTMGSTSDFSESETYELEISDNFVAVAKSWNLSNPTIEQIEIDECSYIKRINEQEFLVHLGVC